MFSTWPEDIINKVAVESRLQDYNSDEVIVRDSSDFHWIVFIIKVNVHVRQRFYRPFRNGAGKWGFNVERLQC